MNHIPKDIRNKFDNKAAQIDPGFKSILKRELFEGKNMTSSKKGSFIKALKAHKYAPFGATLIAVLVVGGASASVTNRRAELAREQEIQLPLDLKDVLSATVLQSQILEELPDSVISGIELESEEGRLLYKVKFSDGTIRLYDAVSGAYISGIDVERSEDVPASFVSSISVQEARIIAQNQRPGKTITKIEYENEEGTVVYGVRFSDGGRVDVSAETGAVVRVRGVNGQNVYGSDDSDNDYESESSSNSNDDSQDEDSEDEEDDQDDHKNEDKHGVEDNHDEGHDD